MLIRDPEIEEIKKQNIIKSYMELFFLACLSILIPIAIMLFIIFISFAIANVIWSF